jgi:hypothetical protein
LLGIHLLKVCHTGFKSALENHTKKKLISVK